MVDEARIRQVLANLLGNVREHTPARDPGRGPAGPGAGRGRAGGGQRRPGMPPQDAARAFDRFHRGSGAGRTGGPSGAGGSGLGLSIVQAIAAAHGGQAQLESWPGDGTRVRVWLPAQRPERTRPKPRAARLRLSPPLQSGWAGARTGSRRRAGRRSPARRSAGRTPRSGCLPRRPAARGETRDRPAQRLRLRLAAQRCARGVTTYIHSPANPNEISDHDQAVGHRPRARRRSRAGARPPARWGTGWPRRPSAGTG